MIFRDDIQKVYDLLAAPERWCQAVSATSDAGHKVDPRDPAACRFCLDGAFQHCGLNYLESESALGLPQCTTPSFNDAPGRTHAEVLALLRSAMERAPVRPVQPDGGVAT